MRRKFEPKEAVTTATEGSGDEDAANKCEVCQKVKWSWCRGGKANEQKKKDRMGWYSVSASEGEDGGREASVEVPPGIMVERDRGQKEDTKRTDNLVARVQKLEESMRWMHQKMWEATSFTVASTEEESASWRRRKRIMAKMVWCLVGQGGAAEPELQTKEADFKRVAEVDCKRTGRDDWIDGRVEERGPGRDGEGKRKRRRCSAVQIIIGRRMS